MPVRESGNERSLVKPAARRNEDSTVTTQKGIAPLTHSARQKLPESSFSLSSYAPTLPWHCRRTGR